MTERMMTIAVLAPILMDMNIPENRLPLNKANIRWMLRNLRIQNGDHPDIEQAISFLKELSRL